MHANENIILMISLSIVLLVSPFISNKLKFPISVVEIALGIILGFFHFVNPHNEYFKLLAEGGFLFLMLLAGMEVNLKDLIKIDKKIYKKAGLFFGLMYILAFWSAHIFGYSFVYVIIFTLISIGLLVSLQQEVGKSEWLSLAMTVGIIGELISILMLTIFSGYVKFGFSKDLLISTGVLTAFLASMGLIFIFSRTLFWWFPNLKHTLMPGIDKYHQDVRIAFALFFILIAALIVLKIDVVLGAFISGVFLRTFFDHNHNLEHKLSPFGFGFLITIFFVYVGSSIDLTSFTFGMMKDILLLTGIMILIRIISAFVFVKELKLKNSILFGLSLSMPLTLLIATATIARDYNYISLTQYVELVITSVVEVIVVMFGVKLINKLQFQKKDS
jgi:Kef-type K+ transport system membrane component KefB